MKNTYIIYRIHVIQINEMAWSLRVRKYTQMNKKESRLKKKKKYKKKRKEKQSESRLRNRLGKFPKFSLTIEMGDFLLIWGKILLR
jgi:hypothetical protein